MKSISKRIHAQFNPTFVGFNPIYGYGGYRRRYNTGSYMQPLRPQVTSAALEAQLDTSQLDPMEPASPQGGGGGGAMNGIAAFGSMAGDSIQQAGALLGGNDSPNWAGNIGGSVAKGAAAGAMLGPIGAGIGAGIGAIGGAVKSLTEKKAMEEQRNAQIRQRNAHMAANLPAQPMYTPTFADGGPLSKERPKGMPQGVYDFNLNMQSPIFRMPVNTLAGRAFNAGNQATRLQYYMDNPDRRSESFDSTYVADKIKQLRNTQGAFNDLVIKKPKYKGKPVDVDAISYASGGGIHIDPSKRGTFTAAATKHGKGVQEFARQVLANKDNYSPAMVKKANFARNASKWHADGGPLTDTIPNSHLNAMYSGVENYLRSQQPSADTTGLSNRFQQSNGVMSTFKEEPINPIDTMSTQTLQQFLPFFRNKVDSLEQNQYYTPQYNLAPTPNKPKLQPIAKAFGGNLDNTTLYETGGTHQSNPMGGIPIGQNALVEEGEVRFDTDGGESYIFSNKIPFKKQ